MIRPVVAVALPPGERELVVDELRAAGFDAVTTDQPADLVALIDAGTQLSVAILDGETDLDASLQFYALLRDDDRSVPALIVVSPAALERLEEATSHHVDDEYFTRPYSVESLRWRVEAMCIRSQVVDDGSGPIIQTDVIDAGDWTRRATVVAVFNPKGGVGKTTVATNLAAALQVRKNQRVLLVDADTVTGHVTTSLGLEQVRTVVDSWHDQLDGGPVESLTEISAEHTSGLRVVALTSSPLATDVLEPERVGEALTAARRGFDYIVVDLHPSYSPLNQAIFERSDRILVPVTPDVPALRAAVQLRDVALQTGLRDKLAMVVNRANSGVSVADMERTVGMPALSLVRSGGLLFVRAANEGRTVIDLFPKERITADFDALADRIMGSPRTAAPTVRSGFRFLNRQKEAARA